MPPPPPSSSPFGMLTLAEISFSRESALKTERGLSTQNDFDGSGVL